MAFTLYSLPMARMLPDRIPDFVRTDLRRAAECDVYMALLETLGDDWTVFGWASWVSRRPGADAGDNEVDFVLAHAEFGVLVLEVKGGAIGFNGTTGAWSSTSRSGVTHPLKESPFQQALRHRYALAKKLEDAAGWRGRAATFGYAVAFPDCAVPAADLGLQVPRELLLTAPDLGRLDERIEAIARYWRSDAPAVDGLGADGLAILTDQFAKSFHMPIPLGRFVADDARQIIDLTESQYRVLDGLSRNRRVLVTGSAGTGKTLLALEKAERLARVDGFRTLLTCFNRPLAEFLRDSAGDVPNLTVLNFHELCADFARRAGLKVPDGVRGGLPNEFYRIELPGMLVEAMATLPDRFEAIVLDEGQDFSATDRAALELTLEDRASAVLYVFQDESQAIYLDGTPWPEEGMSTYVLTENRRNTQAIHAVLARLGGETGTTAVGPPGTAPEFIRAKTPREQAQELSRALHRLIREQAVPPGAIAVLTSSRRAVPDLVQDGRIGAFEVTTEHDASDDRVLVESVTRFKGLERDVVILVRLDPVAYLEFEALLYVGASRARAMLIVIGEDELIARFEGGAAR